MSMSPPRPRNALSRPFGSALRCGGDRPLDVCLGSAEKSTVEVL